MKFFRWILAIIALGLLGYGFHIAMTVPADEAMFNVQRIFYYHIPAWIMTSLCFGANLIGSVVYLAARNKRPTLARYAWGIWWTWDERLTSTLILWLIYVSYLLLRNFSAGPQMRTVSAVLAIFGYIDVPIVYMSTRWWRTQHPAPVFFGAPGSGIAASMKPAVTWNVYAWMAWALLVISIRYAVERRQQQIDEAAALQSLNDPAPIEVTS
jgi:heme exporter protein C